MKSWHCPNCGKKQNVRLDIPSKIVVPCPECGRSLMVKRDKDALTVKAQEPAAAQA